MYQLSEIVWCLGGHFLLGFLASFPMWIIFRKRLDSSQMVGLCMVAFLLLHYAVDFYIDPYLPSYLRI